MKRFSALIPALVASLAAAPARAEDTGDLEGLLEQSVVSAPSKSDETTSTAPATAISVSGDDLRRHGIRTLDEAINYLSVGLVAEKKFQTAEVGARGVLISNDFGSHVLLMIDGHVISEPWGATAYFDRGAAIPFEMIDHIEFVLGPGSVLYGSNAMLGIVNVVTRRAKDFGGLHAVVDSELGVPPSSGKVGGSLRGMLGYGTEFQLFGRDAEIVAGVEYFEQQGPSYEFERVDVGPDEVSGLDRQYSREAPPNVWGGLADDAYFTHAPAGYMRLRVGDVEAGVRAAGYNRTYPIDSGNFDDPDSDETDRWLSLDLTHRATLSPQLHLSTRLYADHYDYVQNWNSTGAVDCLEGQDAGCHWYLEGVADWVGLEPQLQADWFGNRRVVTMAGVDGRVKQVSSYVDYIDAATGQSPGRIGEYDLTELAVAAYVQQTAWVAEVLAFNVGARFDADDRFGSHLSPRAAATLLPWDGGAVKAIYSEAFRAPTAFDTYYEDPRTQVAGGDLDPEIVRSVEGSVEQRFGTQRVMIGVFRSWWTDLLATVDLDDAGVQAALDRGDLVPGTTYAYKVSNLSSIRSTGLNFAYDGSLVTGRLRYGLSVTEAYARLEDPGGEPVQLPISPSWFGNARVSYDLSKGLPTLGLAARVVSERLTDRDDGSHADPQLELRGTVTGPIAAGLSYDVTGNYALRTESPYGTGNGPWVPYDQFRTMVALRWDSSAL